MPLFYRQLATHLGLARFPSRGGSPHLESLTFPCSQQPSWLQTGPAGHLPGPAAPLEAVDQLAVLRSDLYVEP